MKHVNVAFPLDEHRVVKAVCASVGISESETLRRCFFFANAVAVERIRSNGEILSLTDALEVYFEDTAEVRELLISIDSLGTRLRMLEIFVKGVAEADGTNFKTFRSQARRLARDVWVDPKSL